MASGADLARELLARAADDEVAARSMLAVPEVTDAIRDVTPRAAPAS